MKPLLILLFGILLVLIFVILVLKHRSSIITHNYHFFDRYNIASMVTVNEPPVDSMFQSTHKPGGLLINIHIMMPSAKILRASLSPPQSCFSPCKKSGLYVIISRACMCVMRKVSSIKYYRKNDNIVCVTRKYWVVLETTKTMEEPSPANPSVNQSPMSLPRSVSQPCAHNGL